MLCRVLRMSNSTSERSIGPGSIVLDLDLTSVLVAVTTLIIVSIVVVITLIVIVWYFKHRQAAMQESSAQVCVSCEHQVMRANDSDHSVSRSSSNQDTTIDLPIQMDHTPALQAHPVHSIAAHPKRPLDEVIDFHTSTSQNDNHADYDLPPEASISTSLVHSYASACDDFLRRCTTDFDQKGPAQVTSESIREIKKLGEGQFGMVILAEVVNSYRSTLQLLSSEHPCLVAVKKLKPGADKGVKRGFEKEIRVMSQLHHENIVRLLGVCREVDMFLIMEYMENGDLHQYLKRRDWIPDYIPSNQYHMFKDFVSVQTLVSMSFQIACGMKYLASLRFIHRDLASRNCLVGVKNVIKIADFGMSRSLYSSHYYKIKGCAILPLRWMATECFYGKFSEKSDVWAFGVTMWEIFTLCRNVPYEGLPNPDLIRDAIRGPHRKLLGRPVRCPTRLYKDVIMACWTCEPNQRADFEEVYSILKHYYNHC